MSLIEQLKERRSELKTERDALYDAALNAKNEQGEVRARPLTTEEDARVSSLSEEIRQHDARIDELQQEELREAAASKHVGAQTSNTQVIDPPVYAEGNHQRSFFKDLAGVQLRGDREALLRLTRHTDMQNDQEKRALGNTNTTGGSGGEFAPPTWLVNDYIKLVRFGRVTADLMTHENVPMNTSSINLPKVLTGTTVAPQTTQNTALSQTDLTTGFVSTGFTTLGGKEVVSQQLLDQSAIPFDRVITQDLAAASAQTIGQQVILGAGTGANNNAVINGLSNATIAGPNQSTFTSASPTAALFYSKANGMLSNFITQRKAAPTAWLMAPQRWYWLQAQVDTQGRPLVVPADVAYNPIADNGGGVDVAGLAGRFLGLPVYIDPNLPTNLGTGTNQDEVFLAKWDDLWFFESPLVAEAFREPYADSMGVLFRLYCYAGTILNRYTTSIATMNGTGLVTPTF